MQAYVLTVFILLLAQQAQSKTYSVFGHKVPDTDTICSAVVYAWELNQRNIPATAYRLGELNPETEYVLKAIGVDLPPLLDGPLEPKTPVMIVDTNNPEELPEGIEKASIHSIVDHHKLSGLTNAEPLEIDMRPLCSATSILYSRAKALGLTPTKAVAGCMLSGLLSDSLEFRSPTTTETDKIFAAELGKLAGLDVHEHATAMLDAKAQIDHLSPKELVMMDTKVFKIGGKKIRVSVLETTQPAMPLKKKAVMTEAQKAVVAEEKLDDMLLFVVDILKEAATFVSCSSTGTSLVEKAWKTKVAADGTVVLAGVLSRKKQIIPALEAAAAGPGEL
jgi:manganese-dependent inorganic pyrophosphatase